MAMVLAFYGKKVTKDDVVKYGRVMEVSEWQRLERLELFAKRQGLRVYRFYDRTQNKSSMKYLIAQGYPLIALGRIPEKWYRKARLREAHYVVVVGYDDINENFIIHDPAGWGGMIKIPYKVFRDFHSLPRSPGLLLCVYE
jgi:hypothetical protein